MEKFVHQWKKHKYLGTAFAIMLVVTLFLVIRLTYSTIYWINHKNVELKGWMRIGYIARSYDLPIKALKTEMGLNPDRRERRPIEIIAKDRNLELKEFEADIQKAINRIKLTQNNDR